MAQIKNDAITQRDVDFAQWYTDVCMKADLVDYSSVKGCMIIRPYGWAIWELMRDEMDRRIKTHGVQNANFPLLIPIDAYPSKNDAADVQVDGGTGSVVATEGFYQKLKVGTLLGSLLVKVDAGAEELCVGNADAAF